MGREAFVVAVGVVAIAMGGGVVACTGDEAVLPNLGTDDANVRADASDDGAALDAGSDGVSPTNGAGDGGSGSGGDACATPIDTTPCGCGAGQSCCSFTDGGTGCYPIGNGPAECISGPDAYISCVSRSSCAPDSVCCAIGTLGGKTGEACGRRLSHFDTACSPADSGTGADPCAGKPVLCSKQSDCEDVGAGRCEPAVMEVLGRTMGVCVK